MEKLQDRFQFLLDSKGLTSYQLSKKTGVSNATLSRIANKGTKPNSKTLETLCKYFNISEDWFVYFRYNKKLFRFKFGINYIQNYRERLSEANALKDALHQKLKEGWNPNLVDPVPEQNNLKFTEALDFAIEKKTQKNCAD